MEGGAAGVAGVVEMAGVVAGMAEAGAVPVAAIERPMRSKDEGVI